MFIVPEFGYYDNSGYLGTFLNVVSPERIDYNNKSTKIRPSPAILMVNKPDWVVSNRL